MADHLISWRGTTILGFTDKHKASPSHHRLLLLLLLLLK
jgi:hypothetical protein